MSLVNKWTRSVAAATALTLLLTACTSDNNGSHAVPETTLSGSTVSAIDEAVSHAMQSADATEAVIGVWSETGDYVAEFSTSGEANFDTKALFKAAQTNQPMLCALTLSLAQEGTLSLDREVSRDIPRETGIGNVTYRQLCDGTSGIADFKKDFAREVLENPTRPWPQGELIAAAMIKNALSWPGLDVHRSDSDALILSQALSVFAKGNLNEMMRERVFEPAQMYSTYVSPKSQLAIPEANSLSGVGYLPGPNCEAGLQDFSETSVTMLGYAGNTVSNIFDIKSFYEHLFRGTFGGEEGLTTLTEVKSVNNPKRDEDGSVTEEAAETISARGFGILREGPLWGFDGAIPGSATAAWHNPDTGYTVVVALNSSAAGATFATSLAHEISAIVLGANVPWTAEEKHESIDKAAVCAE